MEFIGINCSIKGMRKYLKKDVLGNMLIIILFFFLVVFKKSIG